MLVNEQAKACIITYSTRFPERYSVRPSSKRPTSARQRITVAKDRGTYGRGIEPTLFACSSHVGPGRFVAVSCTVLVPSFQRDTLHKPGEFQQRPCNALPKSSVLCDLAPPSKDD